MVAQGRTEAEQKLDLWAQLCYAVPTSRECEALTPRGLFVKRSVHGALVRFRVNESLVAEAEARARRDAMTLSELMRHALRRELSEAA